MGVHEITHSKLVQECFSWKTEQAQSLFITVSDKKVTALGLEWSLLMLIFSL